MLTTAGTLSAKERLAALDERPVKFKKSVPPMRHVNSHLMRPGEWLHQGLAWLVLCVMMFGVFAPFISKWLAYSQSWTWTEVCTSQGTKLVPLVQGSMSPSDGRVAADNHCGYCLLQQHTPVVPTKPHAFHGAMLSCTRLALAQSASTHPTRFMRDAHRTRAPPALS